MSKNFILGVMLILSVCCGFTACNDNTEVSLQDEEAVSALSPKEKAGESDTTAAISGQIVVYVNGAVKRPGVYTLKQGDRIYQAINMAGGMTAKAKKDAINLAETVTDAQNIYVMTTKEYQDNQTEIHSSQGNDMQTDLVNINTADKDTLTRLPGIGQSKAAAIITYREENGLFSSKEDIKNVSGIGDATYANIEDLITIK